MQDGALLLVGAGGLGCRWASYAHLDVEEDCDLLLVDSDPLSLDLSESASTVCLGPEGSEGAILPELGHDWAKAHASVFADMFDRAELVLIAAGLGGGVGSGASTWLAEQARSSGALVVTVVGLPFEDQVARMRWARLSRPRLEAASHATIGISLSALALRAEKRGSEWESGGGWVPSLIRALVQTQARKGVINLDLMDLRTVLTQAGRSTVLVAQGDCYDPQRLFQKAFDAPLERIDLVNAATCLLHIEGGDQVTLGDFDRIADAFTRGLSDNCHVIYGASIVRELEGEVRVIAVLAGL